MPGITIGEGAIIASGAVVTKNVAPYTLVAGNPAKPIKTRFDETTIARLLQLNLYDWPEAKFKALQPYISANAIAVLEKKPFIRSNKQYTQIITKKQNHIPLLSSRLRPIKANTGLFIKSFSFIYLVCTNISLYICTTISRDRAVGSSSGS
ncbi:hypothetical protein QNH98_12225 [Myroides sp. mNGS23_01]|nr:hypothetical protein [Myroides sp. mNGS23_01]WHT40920.1 hypothetical protein QNH98_12225 [Myroides sp. mNGS23_01]